MTELITAAQMRAAESAAVAEGAASGLDLMERAGGGVVAAMLETWPGIEKGRGPAPAPPGYLKKMERIRVDVLCGPGNNGGDGFVVARLLHRRGWAVRVFMLGDPDRLPADARINYERWLALGRVAGLADLPKDPQEADLIVDALFGTGLSRPVAVLVKEVIGRCAQAEDRVVAVDVPSGLCSDSGKVLGSAMRAALTVSFHRAKTGHYLAQGPARCGRVAVVDIGVPSGRDERLVKLSGPPSPAVLSKRGAAHKFGHGHVIVVSGGPGRTGAARLAARSALRIGAGLVTLAVPPAAQLEVASQITAVMLASADDADALAAVLDDRRITATCLGPGLGVDRAPSLVQVALNAAHRPGVVLDADALSGFSETPDRLFAGLHGGCVLTPHAGEFARLFPDLAAELQGRAEVGPAFSKVDAVRAAARRAGCTVLLKGADTVIADPDGQCRIHSAQYERAAPWLATAGSGDVLAGIITGLVARGTDPMTAAEAGAWLHVEAARRFGPGLIAEDLAEMLPDVLRDLER